METYTNLIDTVVEKFNSNRLETVRALEGRALDMLLLLMKLLTDPGQSLTTCMREKLQKEICRATGTDPERLAKMLDEELDRFFENAAEQSLVHMYD